LRKNDGRNGCGRGIDADPLNRCAEAVQGATGSEAGAIGPNTNGLDPWVDDDCLIAVAGACPRAGPWPDPWDRRDLAEARADLAAWIGKWQTKYPRLVAWVEENIEETLTFYRRRASITSL
jgi:hypothetical protein